MKHSPSSSEAESCLRVDAYVRATRALLFREDDPLRGLLAFDVESPEVISELRRHHLLPLFGLNLPAPLVDALPSRLGVAIRERTRDRELRLSALLALFDELDAALRSLGVEYLLFKGFHLGDRFYGDLSKRPQFDLDVLIRERDLSRVVRHLKKRGFARVARDEHSVTYRLGKAEVDLHWKLRNCPAYRLDESAIWRTKVRYELGHRSFLTLSDDYLVALLALSIVHDLERGCCKVKQLLDLYLVLRELDGELDWDAFVDQRRRENLLELCLTGIQVVVHAFECASEVPRVRALLQRESKHLRVRGRAEVLDLLRREQGDIGAKVWFLDVYPGSPLHYRAWLVYRQFPGILLRVRPSWVLKVPRLALGVARRVGARSR